VPGPAVGKNFSGKKRENAKKKKTQKNVFHQPHVGHTANISTLP
jgi:hypothetical protein